MAGVFGLKPLGLATIEGFANGFPLKLLLMGLLISEFLGLEFGLLEVNGEEEYLFEGTAIDFSDLNDGSLVIDQYRQKNRKSVARM